MKSKYSKITIPELGLLFEGGEHGAEVTTIEGVLKRFKRDMIIAKNNANEKDKNKFDNILNNIKKVIYNRYNINNI